MMERRRSCPIDLITVTVWHGHSLRFCSGQTFVRETRRTPLRSVKECEWICLDSAAQFSQNCTADDRMPRIYTKISAIFALAIAIMLLFAFTLWRNVLLVQLASILLALSLVLAINRRSWLWYGIVLFGLSTGAYQAWTHQERFWASLYGITVAYGLIQLFRRMH